MKTIREIAEETGVTPQAIYKRLNQLSMVENLNFKVHIHKEAGKTVIDKDGERILTEGLIKEVDNEVNEVENEFNAFLKEQIRVKDKQIEDLTAQIETLLQKIENFQILLKNDQEIIKSLPSPNKFKSEDKDHTKKNIFKKLFRRD